MMLQQYTNNLAFNLNILHMYQLIFFASAQLLILIATAASGFLDLSFIIDASSSCFLRLDQIHSSYSCGGTYYILRRTMKRTSALRLFDACRTRLGGSGCARTVSLCYRAERGNERKKAVRACNSNITAKETVHTLILWQLHY